MNTADKPKSRFTVEDAVFIVVFVAGAWALGFLLGFG